MTDECKEGKTERNVRMSTGQHNTAQCSAVPASRQLAMIRLGATGWPKGSPLESITMPRILTILERRKVKGGETK